VALNSATSALHVACRALGLQSGDWLWTVPNTFVASANCALYCGAQVDFVDIDPDTWNLSLPALREKLIVAKRNGRLPKVLVPVLFAGLPTEQDEIWELAQEFGFKVLEDASHAIGASRHNEPVGSCRWSHVTVFSFHPVKIITTGEGGMALTNDEELAWRMALLRSHGITREPERMNQDVPGPWYYEQIDLGYNYRLTDLQAALGLSQLERLSSFVETRNTLAKYYGSLLDDLPLKTQKVQDGNRSSFHLYVVRLACHDAANAHRAVFESLREKGIGVNLHYIPVYLQPYYRRLGFQRGLCPEAERHAREAISLPLFPGLTNQQQRLVAQALRNAIK
jgi:UDP-4-amino-4,6-dideoxy-N-acetyl-beta-L-altrosamine transaminase